MIRIDTPSPLGPIVSALDERRSTSRTTTTHRSLRMRLLLLLFLLLLSFERRFLVMPVRRIDNWRPVVVPFGLELGLDGDQVEVDVVPDIGDFLLVFL